MSGADPRGRGPFGPLESLDEVQRQALEAALRVAGELGGLTGDLASAPWLGGQPGTPGADALDVGRLRSDVGRAAESMAELFRAVLDVGFDAMDELARRPGPASAAAAPHGGLARVEVAVANPGREPVAGARPHVPHLTAADGTALDAVVTVRPATVDLPAGGRATVEVEVVVAPDAAPGAYHGLLLVDGLAAVAHPVRVDVEDAG